MIMYLLKSSVTLLLLILFYKLSLEKERSFSFNRFYLLAAILISLTAPLITVETEMTGVMADALNTEWMNAYPAQILDDPALGNASAMRKSDSVSNTLSLAGIAALVYSFGFLLFFSKYLRNLMYLIRKCASSSYYEDGKFKIVIEKEDTAPQSFFNYLFMPKGAPDAVMQHEKRHASAYHSADVIFIELLKVVFWFNPVMHWTGKLLKQNHEFYADAEPGNIDLKNYKQLIINHIYKQKANSLASGFDYSIIKKRIKMLQRTRSGPWLWAKKVAVLPLFALAVLVACEKSQAQDQKERQEVNSKISKVVTEFEGSTIDGVKYYHADYEGAMTGKEIAMLIKGEGLVAFDKITIEVAGSRYAGSYLGYIRYTEAAEDFFMRKLKKGEVSGLFILKVKVDDDGQKYRGINLGESNNWSVRYDGDKVPPPPPPPTPPAAPANGVTPPPPPPPPITPPLAPEAPKPPRYIEHVPDEDDEWVVPPPPPPGTSTDDIKEKIRQIRKELKRDETGEYKLTDTDRKRKKAILKSLEKHLRSLD